MHAGAVEKFFQKLLTLIWEWKFSNVSLIFVWYCFLHATEKLGSPIIVIIFKIYYYFISEKKYKRFFYKKPSEGQMFLRFLPNQAGRLSSFVI